MGFSLQISNDLKSLAQRLAQDLSVHGKELPVMQAQWIITQTEGMNSWLKNTIAQHAGITANIRFIQPADVVSSLQRMTALEDSADETFSKEEMCWVLFDLLGNQEFTSRFPLVSEYYQSDDLRKSTLAQKLADLFDQYLVYRSDVIAKWNNLSNEEVQRTGEWQAVLWTELRKRFGENVPDRTQIADRIIERLKQKDVSARVHDRMPHLYIFGIAVITPFFQRIFKAMSESSEIHMFLLNPAPKTYWMDFVSEKQLARLLKRADVHVDFENHPPLGNDLLLNWGKIIKDSFWLLFQDEDLINTCDDHLALTPSNPKNLLQKLKYGIFHNLPVQELQEGNEITILNDEHKDGSVIINGCYTPAREVEVLYNYFVSLMDSPGSQYSSRDFLVMVPDIDLYAPYIHAVFGQASHRFKYTVADERIASENNIFTALQALIEFDGESFKAESVVELLDYPYIRARFQFDDVEKLRESVRQAAIFHGLNGREEDDTRMVSWDFGLKKMIYGWCMQSHDDFEFYDGTDHVPLLNSAEGAAGLDRIRLAYFIKVLAAKVQERMQPRSLAQWADYLKQLLEDMVFQAGEKDDEDYPRFIRLIEELTDMKDVAQAEVSFEVFRHSLLTKLSAERRSHQFAGKGITFCSLVPMRSIPFRVVALLGMNFDAFPRRENPVNFSLLSENRRGDRNVKENDKHLFLETVLSAQESLYLSYQARSEKDGTKLPPSVLVDELISFVARVQKKDAEKLRDEWVTIHPLHGFSKHYHPKGLVSYLSPDRFKTRVDIRKVPERLVPEIPNQLDIRELANFLQNPPKTFLTKFFGIWYQDDDVLLSDHEVFELDQLQKHQIKQQLVQLQAESRDSFIRKNSRSGKLPLHNLGVATVALLEEDLAGLQNSIRLQTEGWGTVEWRLSLDTGDIRLIGKPEVLYTKEERLRYVHWTTSAASSSTMRQSLSGFVNFLALRASGYDFEFVKINVEGKVSVYASSAVSQEVALSYLNEMVDHYRHGVKNYFIFFPELADWVAKEKSWSEVVRLVEHAKSGSTYNHLKDPYFLRAIEDGFLGEENFETLRRNTQRIDEVMSACGLKKISN